MNVTGETTTDYFPVKTLAKLNKKPVVTKVNIFFYQVRYGIMLIVLPRMPRLRFQTYKVPIHREQKYEIQNRS